MECGLDRETLQAARALVRLRGGVEPRHAGVRVDRAWDGALCRSTLANDGPSPVRVEEVVLFAAEHTLPATTPFYGEGFQMLSQTAGTLGDASTLSKYGDHSHYKLPQPPGAVTVYNLALLEPAPGWWLLVCFVSCRRFQGSLRFWPDRIEVVADTEGMTLQPGEWWELEEVFCQGGADRDALLASAAAAIEQRHPRLKWTAPPTG
jgi:alpha-galactosidase